MVQIKKKLTKKILLSRNSVLVEGTDKLTIIKHHDSCNNQFWNWCYEKVGRKTYIQDLIVYDSQVSHRG